MGVCTFFVFSAIWEYVIVCILERRPLGGCRHKSGSRGSRGSLGAGLIIPNLHATSASTHDLPHFDLAGRSLSLRSSRSIARLAAFHHVDLTHADRQPNNHSTSSWHRQSTSFPHPAVSPQGSLGERQDQQQLSKTSWEPKPETVYGAIQTNNHRAAELQDLTRIQSTTLMDDELAVVENKRKKRIKINCSCRSSQPATSAAERSKRVDIIARFAYPALFLLFNLFYWPYYLTMTPHSSIP
ncbi:hypothetical protein RvY_17016 [Ramazzottius varieornatus]|uniref:Neurotransmitter-gated ion-channel transmembrane domain-containing protein n=1 Tax=Ramazzottius varieornatus TaxID=947166 RepID=A0A1D1W159_RAMVA|nr:hypothetical protein RvY_17016 [Ramazzottius varieornatus]